MPDQSARAAAVIAASNGHAALPVCATHPDSVVRRYRAHGANGPGVYPQCVPTNGDATHLLDWEVSQPPRSQGDSRLSATEIEILIDAANGLTVKESAARRSKGAETVKTQRKMACMKLDARNLVEAVSIAAQRGLIARDRAA